MASAGPLNLQTVKIAFEARLPSPVEVLWARGRVVVGVELESHARKLRSTRTHNQSLHAPPCAVVTVRAGMSILGCLAVGDGHRFRQP